jgi:hypothetical protein
MLAKRDMLIYLDANIVQYCADHWSFVSGASPVCQNPDRKLQKELGALRSLVEMEQLSDWTFAATAHLLAELRAGKPTNDQVDTCELLQQAWGDSIWSGKSRANEDAIRKVEQSLADLRLKDAADRRHLAEAIALNASWFLTNDKDILKKAKSPKAERGLGPLRVCRPSECLQHISTGLFLR